MQRKRIKKLQSGDLAVITSPYMHVTLDGYVKSDPSFGRHITGYSVDDGGDVKTFDVPYETVVMVVDEMKAFVMYEGRILMVPRSCLHRIDDER